jgi:hypothetical protein
LHQPEFIGLFQLGFVAFQPYIVANPARSINVTSPSLFKSAAASWFGGNGVACTVLIIKDAEAIIDTIIQPKIAIQASIPSFFISLSPLLILVCY